MAVDAQVVGARLAALDEHLRFLVDVVARLERTSFTADPRNDASAVQAQRALPELAARLCGTKSRSRPPSYGRVFRSKEVLRCDYTPPIVARVGR